jgi:hypothetical protein
MNTIIFLDQNELFFVFLESACYQTPILIWNFLNIQARYSAYADLRITTATYSHKPLNFQDLLPTDSKPKLLHF